MFQNITDEVLRDDEEDVKLNSKESKRNRAKELFSIQNILVYVIAFMVSMVSFNGMAPFAIAIFAAVLSNRVAAGITYIACLLGTLLSFGLQGGLQYILTTLIFIVMILIFKPQYKYLDETRNEKQKLGIYLVISILISHVGYMVFDEVTVHEILMTVITTLTVYIFYKIFANSISVIKEYGRKLAFSIEEVMGASMLLSIALASLAPLRIYDFSITNILSIMIVLFLGWKNGVLVGTTSGVTIGIVLGIITKSEPILIAAFAISGMLAGLCNRLGKLGVIIGFFIGNAIFTYVANKTAIPIITVREILIASLGLLFIPKNVKINISDIVTDVKLLPVSGGALEENEDAIYKLNSVSETIREMAKSYNEVAATTIETEEELEYESKKNFADELLSSMDEISENILYEDIINEDCRVIDDIYDILKEKNEITDLEILGVFEKNNNYIIGIDSTDTSRNKQIQEDINKIVRRVNATYRTNKLNLVWKQKEAANKKTLASQLGGVSKVISTVADEMKKPEAEVREETKPKFKMQIGISKTTKNKSEVSGDSNIATKLRDGKYMMAISDGMGSRD